MVRFLWHADNADLGNGRGFMFKLIGGHLNFMGRSQYKVLWPAKNNGTR